MLICGELLRTRSVQRRGKESCVICVHTTCALPQPLPWASLHGVSRYSQLLVDNVADAWPCVTTGGCKCYSYVSCTVPPATWTAATSERRRARIERARRGARQLVAQQQWQHDRSGAAAQAKLGAARFHASDGAAAAIGYAPGVAHLGPHQRRELTEIN